MSCPSCGAKIKEGARLCVKCGADLARPNGSEEPGAPRPTSPRKLESLKYLRELAPSRSHVRQLLPHPTGWVLGLGLPLIGLVALVHMAVLPSPAEKSKSWVTLELKATPAQKTEFQTCLAASRTRADARCGRIAGAAQTLRRISCQVTSRAAGFTRCAGSAAGRFGSCLKRCGQKARSCSSSCAIIGGKSWRETASCLLPCWKTTLDSCLAGCFSSR